MFGLWNLLGPTYDGPIRGHQASLADPEQGTQKFNVEL
jgi:hypothetical protein